MADRIESFVRWLIEDAAEDRAVRAALRRGLGQPPGYVPEVLMQLAPRVQGMREWQAQTAYTLAPLFALHPLNTADGNMGDHLRRLRDYQHDEALERRFGVLLAAHDEELDTYLRQAITMLRQKDIPVNWLQLFHDVNAWGHPDAQARTRRKWANSFYRQSPPAEVDADSIDSSSNE